MIRQNRLVDEKQNLELEHVGGPMEWILRNMVLKNKQDQPVEPIESSPIKQNENSLQNNRFSSWTRLDSGQTAQTT